MGQEQIKNGHAHGEANNEAPNKVTAKPKKRLFAAGHFATNDLAILLFGLVVLFVSEILPVTPKTKIIYAIFLIVCTAILIIHAFANRNVETEEETNEQFRRETDKSFDEVDADLETIQKTIAEQKEKAEEIKRIVSTQGQKINELDKEVRPRSLNQYQISFIAARLKSGNHVARFAVQFHRGSGDAGTLAHDILKALLEAGWEQIIDPLSFQHQFRPLEFRMSEEEHKSLPPVFSVLANAFNLVGMAGDNVPITIDNKVPKGDVYIYVGSRV